MTVGDAEFSHSDGSEYTTTSGSYVTQSENTISIPSGEMYYIDKVALQADIKSPQSGDSFAAVRVVVEDANTGAELASARAENSVSGLTSSYKTKTALADFGHYVYDGTNIVIQEQQKHPQADGDNAYVTNFTGVSVCRRIL